MYTELRYKSLSVISVMLPSGSEIRSRLGVFLAKEYDEYYVYDRKIHEGHYIEIAIPDIEIIIDAITKADEMRYECEELEHVLHAVRNIDGCESIFLYGGNRV